MSLKADLENFEKGLRKHAELMDKVIDADDWGPLDTAEAAEELYNEFIILLEKNGI